jgi:hypothetical protein
MVANRALRAIPSLAEPRSAPRTPAVFRSLRSALALALPLCPSASASEVRPVEVPLLVPHAFLQRLLVEQVFVEPGATARIAAAADPCNEIVLSEPRIGHARGRLLVTARGRAEAGFAWPGGCVRPFAWEGEIEAEEEARLARDAPVVLFPVADSRLRGGGGFFDVPTLWDWVKPVVHPRLETLRVDMGPLVGELRRALPLFAERREEAAVRRLAESIALAEARVEARGLVLRLRFDVETGAARAAAPAPAPPLTPAEAAAFEAALRDWDAFVTFVVKTAGHDALHPALRAELLAALLEARHELVAALEAPARRGEDPVRALFASAWTRLAPSLVDLAGGDDGFRYLAFVAAGDALAALDAAGPAFGVEISSDGLRRLARTLAPAAAEDPLRWSEQVDPELRETFGFDTPLPALPPPAAGEAAGAEEPVDRDVPAGGGEPAAGEAAGGEEPAGGEGPADGEEPPGEKAPEEPAAGEEPASDEPSAEELEALRPGAPGPGAARSLWERLVARLAGLLVAPARAAPAALPPPGPHSSALDARAPRLAELDAYLPQVAELLRDAASVVFAHGGLGRERLEPFRHLVLAAAWQESCWRQYVERRGRTLPLRSRVGALGLMQVNPRVWRGFYAADGLAWSIGYNARAGSEILLHYLRDYALARGEEALGGPDALARASYATYHGGPSHLRRYREPERWRSELVSIDRAFHEKYRIVAAGSELDVRTCFAG